MYQTADTVAAVFGKNIIKFGNFVTFAEIPFPQQEGSDNNCNILTWVNRSKEAICSVPGI